MVEAMYAVRPVPGHVVEMLGDLGAPTLQQDVAHMTERLASLTGADPAFLCVPGVVASPAIRDALLRQDPHAPGGAPPARLARPGVAQHRPVRGGRAAAARTRWAVAGGKDKYAILRAALTGRWVDRLVTDTATAGHLLEGKG